MAMAMVIISDNRYDSSLTTNRRMHGHRIHSNPLNNR